jgi:hypothetical protein
MRSGTKLVLLATVCVIASLLSAGNAAATTYCVGMDACVGGVPEPGIQAAFDTAGTHAGADTVLIGPLGSPYTGDFNYGYQSDTVSVIGVGLAKPVIQATPGLVYAMKVNSTSSALTQNLAFVAPNEDGGTGLAWSGTADNIAVTHTGTGKEIHALFPYGDTLLENSSAKIEGDGFGTGISLQLADDFTMRDSSIEGTTRVGLDTTLPNPNVILQRVALTANTVALVLGGTGTDVTAQQVLLRGLNLGSTGAVVSLLNGTHLDATHATIVGSGTGRGVTVGATTASSLAEIDNSVVANVEDSGVTSGKPGFPGVLTFTHTMVPKAPLAFTDGSSNMGVGAVLGFPTFADPVAGDYHLTAPQPAIDAADPADTTTQDLAKQPRIVDGDGAGGARSDFGAYEYQRSTPVAAITVPSTIKRGKPAIFSAMTSSDADPGDTLTYSWNFGDGASGTGASVTHVFTAEGAKTVSLTATDQLGLSSISTAQFTVTDGTAPAFTIGKPKPNKKGTSVTYKIGCPKTEKSCTVTAAITKSNGKKKPIALAKNSKVAVKGGRSKTLTLKLNKTALKLIKSKHKLKTQVRFVGTDAAGNTKTVVQKYTAKQGKTGSAK